MLSIINVPDLVLGATLRGICIMFQSKIARWLWYIAVNGIFAGSIYYGLILGTGEYTSYAANLALFMGWVTAFFGGIILLAITINSGRRRPGDYIEFVSRQDISPIPFEVDLVFDIGVCIAFIITGHQVLTIFYIISIFAGKKMRDIPRDEMLNKLQGQK